MWILSKDVDDAVKTVVKHEDDGKILTVQRSSSDSRPLTWEFPGGGVEEDEEIREASVRELEEETGLQGEIVRQGESGELELENRVLRFHVFEVEVQSKEVDLSREHRDFQWVSKEKIRKLDSDNAMQKNLEAINEW